MFFSSMELGRFVPSPIFSPSSGGRMKVRSVSMEQNEGEKCEHRDESARDDEVEAVVESSTSDVDAECDVDVRLRTTVVCLDVSHRRCSCNRTTPTTIVSVIENGRKRRGRGREGTCPPPKKKPKKKKIGETIFRAIVM